MREIPDEDFLFVGKGISSLKYFFEKMEKRY